MKNLFSHLNCNLAVSQVYAVVMAALAVIEISKVYTHGCTAAL